MISFIELDNKSKLNDNLRCDLSNKKLITYDKDSHIDYFYNETKRVLDIINEKAPKENYCFKNIDYFDDSDMINIFGDNNWKNTILINEVCPLCEKEYIFDFDGYYNNMINEGVCQNCRNEDKKSNYIDKYNEIVNKITDFTNVIKNIMFYPVNKTITRNNTDLQQQITNLYQTETEIFIEIYLNHGINNRTILNSDGPVGQRMLVRHNLLDRNIANIENIFNITDSELFNTKLINFYLKYNNLPNGLFNSKLQYRNKYSDPSELIYL